MILTNLLALALALSASTAAGGNIDMDYEGEINIYTGEPIVADDESDEQKVTVAEGVVYDYEKNLFTYTLPGNKAITIDSSVPDKMITTKEVSLGIDENINAKLYLDGEELDMEDIDLTELDDTGSYALVVGDSDSEYQVLSFTIVPEKTGMISSYQLPDGFELVEVTINDDAQNISDKNIVKMKKEGTYLISYRCKASKVEYALKVDIDHTPPAVKLDGVSDGKASGAVTVSGIDKDDSVSVTKDGEVGPGVKVTEREDKFEGNKFEEEFEIRFYLDRQGLLFGMLALAVIISIIVYMVRARKKLRVR